MQSRQCNGDMMHDEEMELISTRQLFKIYYRVQSRKGTGEPYKGLAGAAVSPVLIAS
jgi:hypothetical protein